MCSIRQGGVFLILLFGSSTIAPAQAPDSSLIRALVSYEGVWLSDAKQDAQGNSFYYRYTLTYFDEGRTILKMKITQEGAAAQVKLLWEGFKGWDPGMQAGYYQGFSTFGLAATGQVYLDSAKHLVTEYRSFNTKGAVYHVRDVFIQQDQDHFTSITYLQGAQGWQELMRDQWTRMPS